MNFSDLPNYGSNSRKRYTLRLLSKCLVKSSLLLIGGKVPPTLRYFFDSLRWAPFSLALHLCSSYVITKWSKIYTKLTPDFKIHTRNLVNFRQVVESQKGSNLVRYICLKTTFFHLKHLQIYVTLLSADLWFGKWRIDLLFQN